MSASNAPYVQMSLGEVYRSRFSDYARYIILSRAIPDVRDGLKPVQRRVLYSMYKERNLPDRVYRKSAKTVGDVMGNYHPHGDSSIYETMVNLVQAHKMREPLIDGHGHWGTVDGDSAAAMRYTEARLTDISMEQLRDIEKDTVEFIASYDNTTQEPTVLPSRFPNLLVNGVTGISIGFATEIPTHNLREVINGSIALLKNPQLTVEELMTHIPGPDLPIGGTIQGKDEILKAYRTGAGRIIIRSKSRIEKGKQGRQFVIIEEIPYTVRKKALVQQIEDEIFERNVDGLLEVRDETDREGLRVVLEIRRDADINGILNYLYRKTDLQISYNFNMLVIADTQPKQLGILEILSAYIDHQKEVVTRRTQYDYDRANSRQHIVEGVIKATSILREVVDTIMNSDGREDARESLVREYEFTQEQADAILDIRLHQLTRLDIKKYEKEQQGLKKELKEWKGILSSNKKLNNVIERELLEIRDLYGTDRRTIIEDEIEEIEIDISVTVPSEEVIVTLSDELYIKRVSLRSFNSSGASLDTTGIKDGDRVQQFIRVNTIQSLLLFTDDGMYFQLPVYEISDVRWKDLGSALINVIGLNKEQKIIAMFPLEDDPKEKYIHFVSRSGMVKKTLLSAYSSNQRKRGIIAVRVRDDDQLVCVFLGQEKEQLLLVSRQAKAIRIDLSDLNPMGRNTIGVKAVDLAAEDEIVGAERIADNNGQVLNLLTTEGVGKRIRVSDIDTQKRGGKGSTVIRQRKRNPHELACAVVEQHHPIKGQYITNQEQGSFDFDELNVTAHAGTGKAVLTLSKGEQITQVLLEPSIVDDQ